MVLLAKQLSRCTGGILSLCTGIDDQKLDNGTFESDVVHFTFSNVQLGNFASSCS